MSQPHPTPYHPASAPDYLPPDQLRQLQFQRLQRMVSLSYENVEMTRTRMQERSLTPLDIRSMDDIRHLPFTRKTDLRDHYPFGLFARPMKEIVRVHASSGTTGKPTVVAYTRNDIEVWSTVMMRTFASCGVSEGDIIQNAYGYGLFTGGLGAHYGAEALRATVIPISGGNSERQMLIMQDFGVTAICCTPSYFLHLIEYAEERGVHIRDLNLHTGIFGAEPWTEGMRERIQSATGIRAYDIYGLSEIIGPGVASECSAQCGLHIFEDCFYPEIIDPDTGDVLPDGETGELVLTTLCKEAMPVLRYRTHDITRLVAEPCACGRTIRRMERVSHRSDDMFIIRGVNVFPSQIETALLQVKETLPHYQIILTRQDNLDRIEVQVEVSQDLLDDTVSGMEALHHRLAQSIEHTLGIRVHLRLVEPRTIERSQGKARRVIDNRNL